MICFTKKNCGYYDTVRVLFNGKKCEVYEEVFSVFIKDNNSLELSIYRSTKDNVYVKLEDVSCFEVVSHKYGRVYYPRYEFVKVKGKRFEKWN